MEFNLSIFCERFSNLREASGMSQDELAKTLKVTQQTLSRYEKGQRQPSVDFIVKAASFFEVSVDYLLGLSEVQSIDSDLRAACQVTGLSDKAIATIASLSENDNIEILNRVILSNSLEILLEAINKFVSIKPKKDAIYSVNVLDERTNLSYMEVETFFRQLAIRQLDSIMDQLKKEEEYGKHNNTEE